jgi:cytochrome P450
VTKLVANAVVLLDRHRESWDRVVADPSLIPGAIEETMRYWPPVHYNGRWTLEPVEFEGGVVPAGQRVALLVAAAARDPRRFEDPDVFDIDRTIQMQIGFGFGIHVCLGANLARAESRIFLEELTGRWPRLVVDVDGLRRVQMENVVGFSSVPVHAT